MMTIGTHTFESRAGITGYCRPYSTAGVKQMAGGKVRLTLTKDINGEYCSAGVLGPNLGDGIYQWQTIGRVDAMDPAAVFAIWLYDDESENEIDVIEWTRWGDLNQPGNMNITAYKGQYHKELPVKLLGSIRNAPCRAYDKYKYTLKMTPTMFYVKIDGWWLENGWHTVQEVTIPRLPGMERMGNVRMALWLPPTGFRHARAGARGSLSFDVFGFTFVPLAEGVV